MRRSLHTVSVGAAADPALSAHCFVRRDIATADLLPEVAVSILPLLLLRKMDLLLYL